MQPSKNKTAAVDLLTMIVSGKIDEAYEKYVDMNGKHHNAFTTPGFPALKQGMKDNDAQFPNKHLVVKNVIGDENLVAVHSHLILDPGKTDMVVIHILRFENDRVVEMWDCGQMISADMPNKDLF